MDNKQSNQRSIADEAAGVAAQAVEHLKRLSELGADGIGRDDLEKAKKRLSGKGIRLNPAEALRQIHLDMGDCRRCQLYEGRTNIVFGDGDPYARLMFVGEGPGEDEDAQGVPFVGKAGQMLNRIIENVMGLKRSDVYTANVVKSRPPGNRDPQPEEIAACLPFLERQIEAIRPEVIVALGAIATQAMTGSTENISRMRGRWHNYKGIPLMPTFHPSYLLHLGVAQQDTEKRKVWEDIKQVMEKLGLPIGGKG